MGEKVQLWVKDKTSATPTCLAMATSLSVEVSADAVDISSYSLLQITQNS